MEKIDVSIFASAVRPCMWEDAFKSLEGTSCSYEVIFGGYCTPQEVYPFLIKYPFLKYVHTGNIKPSQVYELTRRLCRGKTITWSADDVEYPNDVIGKAYTHWRNSYNDKLILSIQTRETGYKNISGTLFDMNIHRFFGGDKSTQLMAPICLMSKKFLQELGGIDKRFVAGQYENLVVMMAYTQGGTVEIFPKSIQDYGKEVFVDIDHLSKSIKAGECTNDDDFRQRPFATGYTEDRKILESICCKINHEKYNAILKTGRKQIYASEIMDIGFNGDFQPYSENISLTKSELPCGKWE